MKLLYAPTSPYVRKVLVLAHETGLVQDIAIVAVAALPTEPNPATTIHNPLGKIPTLITKSGEALFDSRVICEYLDARSPGIRLFPAEGPARWRALSVQALADGLLDAALLIRYERVVRPEPLRWEAWDAGQAAKVAAALDRLETLATDLAGPLHIGTVAAGCALGYLDFRYPDLGWRESRPALEAWYAGFAQRPSMTATAPPAA